MVADEPRLRRRGFFLHSSDATEPDGGELENAEGLGIRTRVSRPSSPRRAISGGRARTDTRASSYDGNPQIRSGSVTGSRQRAHLPR
jgi:hypothetical protein